MLRAKRAAIKKSEGPALATVLSSIEGVKAFAAHLVSELSLENLYFYLAVKAWKDDFSKMTDEEKHERATHILNTYVLPSSPLEVNISHSPRTELIMKLNNHEFTKNMFDSSGAEVYLLMENDSYSRFKRSRQFQAYMNNVTDLTLVVGEVSL